MDCIFCRIVAGQIPAQKVYEDEDVLAFEDINPLAPVHVLLIPKKHIADLTALEPEDAGLIAKIHLAALQVAKAKGVAASGFRLVNNCKADGGQVVYHLHYHLLGGAKLKGFA